MIQLNSITLLTIYLKECSGFVESLLKRGLTASLNSWEKSLIQEIGHLANVLSVIYFYRK